MRPVRLVVSAVAVVVACGALAACGGGSSSDDDRPAVKEATDQQIQGYAKSASADAVKVAAKLRAAYLQDKRFPKSAKGLVGLARGNEIGAYRSTSANTVDVCVQHVEKQPNPDDTTKVIDMPLAAAAVIVSADVDGNVSQPGNPAVSTRSGC
jgi:hypothetical protein